MVLPPFTHGIPPSPPMDTSFPPWMPRRSYLCPAWASGEFDQQASQQQSGTKVGVITNQSPTTAQTHTVMVVEITEPHTIIVQPGVARTRLLIRQLLIHKLFLPSWESRCHSKIELNECYQSLTMQSDGNDWTTIPDLDDFRDCVSIIGVNCIVDKCESK
ncbi:hypothetical protein AVEN_17492-1 [Araneus ventricosus]|uniref:Uncharacterized protein n=1 Tax=Araneus ventricosus TaxID=182803 RepID=A0A4Y2JG73_ARAVE|nr:hypothetical protein AVEN_17492-1 [Araneus ventricosus]